MAIPLDQREGIPPSISIRSAKVPLSPSSALQTMYLRGPGAVRTVSHFDAGGEARAAASAQTALPDLRDDGGRVHPERAAQPDKPAHGPRNRQGSAGRSAPRGRMFRRCWRAKNGDLLHRTEAFERSVEKRRRIRGRERAVAVAHARPAPPRPAVPARSCRACRCGRFSTETPRAPGLGLKRAHDILGTQRLGGGIAGNVDLHGATSATSASARTRGRAGRRRPSPRARRRRARGNRPAPPSRGRRAWSRPSPGPACPATPPPRSESASAPTA